MTKKQIIKYLNLNVADGVEFIKKGSSVYIKWDFLPFKLREFIFKQPDYDETKMIHTMRECGCGEAYFYEESNFFEYCKRIKDLTEIGVALEGINVVFKKVEK